MENPSLPEQIQNRANLAEELANIAERVKYTPETVSIAGVLYALASSIMFGTERQILSYCVNHLDEMKRKVEKNKVELGLKEKIMHCPSDTVQ